MVEVAAAISMAVSAYNGIKKAVEMGREVEDITGYFGKFFDAKETISEASQYNENAPLYDEVISYMESINFKAVEVLDTNKNKKSYQQDILFINQKKQTNE